MPTLSRYDDALRFPMIASTVSSKPLTLAEAEGLHREAPMRFTSRCAPQDRIQQQNLSVIRTPRNHAPAGARNGSEK